MKSRSHAGATGKEFARYWIHNGFVQINQEKMSKSLGNFFTIREIFEKSEWPEAETGEMLRYFLTRQLIIVARWIFQTKFGGSEECTGWVL